MHEVHKRKYRGIRRVGLNDCALGRPKLQCTLCAYICVCRSYTILVYQTRSVLRYEVQCCNGYEGEGDQCLRMSICTHRACTSRCVHKMLQVSFVAAICDGCNEPNICEAPNTCLCPDGWTGQQCSEGEIYIKYELKKFYKKCTLNIDIDECQSPGVCERHCINTAGSYLCCPDGSALADDQSSCIGWVPTPTTCSGDVYMPCMPACISFRISMECDTTCHQL